MLGSCINAQNKTAVKPFADNRNQVIKWCLRIYVHLCSFGKKKTSDPPPNVHAQKSG